MIIINVIIWTAVAHFVYYVISEFKQILDIKVFTIKPKANNEEQELLERREVDEQNGEFKKEPWDSDLHTII